MQKWEYLQVYVSLDDLDEFQKRLDAYGEASWELVSMMPIDTKSWLAGDTETSALLAIFKRPK